MAVVLFVPLHGHSNPWNAQLRRVRRQRALDRGGTRYFPSNPHHQTLCQVCSSNFNTTCPLFVRRTAFLSKHFVSFP